ncbi:MAG: putative oxidoreductase [Micromonosporaceae bacterium]|nr:putative oxidoreductase [Micromonosporaceae bacterium]MDT5036457.1 putative oxidoreductase [Micromonosporaceae bacterium]
MSSMHRRAPVTFANRLSDSELMGRLLELRQLVDRVSVTLLRISVGVVFIWFGALKITGATPVAKLVAATVPILPANVFVPALGAFEVVLGLALLIGRHLDLVAVLLVAHLTGTFLVLVMEPNAAFEHGNPLMLTMTGEFVIKNIVLIAAGLVLATKCASQPSREPAAAPVSRTIPVPEPADGM